MGEPGNRTRYYGALVDEGCTIRKYATLPDLRRNALASAIEHLQRHVSAKRNESSSVRRPRPSRMEPIRPMARLAARPEGRPGVRHYPQT